MADADEIRWGIIGPGGIARAFAAGRRAFADRQARRDRRARPEEARATASISPAPASSTATQALLADPEVEAVYIATPHPQHAEWAIKAANAGKHVLVEKPMGLTAYEADAMIARGPQRRHLHGRGLHVPAAPADGEARRADPRRARSARCRMIQSSFGFAMPKFDPKHRLYANDLAGGGILDVGCYPVSMARLIAGAAAGKPFARPGQGRRHREARRVRRRRMGGGDAAVSRTASSPRSSCAVSLDAGERPARPRDQGRIEVPNFWFASGHEGGVSKITVVAATARAAPSRSRSRGWLYSFEADAAGEAIRAGRQEFAAPGMSWADTLGNLRVLDKWRADAGLNTASRSRGRGRAPSAAPRWRSRGSDPAQADPGPREVGLAAGARLRGLPRLRQRLDPARRLLGGAAATSSTPAGSTAWAAPSACSASG